MTSDRPAHMGERCAGRSRRLRIVTVRDASPAATNISLMQGDGLFRPTSIEKLLRTNDFGCGALALVGADVETSIGAAR